MLFNSQAFLIFFPLVWLAHWLLRTPRHRLGLLVGASLFFYGFWDWRFLGLLLFSIFVDFLVGRSLGRTTSVSRRRGLLSVSVMVNLGVLALFKYFDFFAESLADLLGLVGFGTDRVTLDLILPLGISFYTFQSLGYSIDVYRRKVEPCRDPLLFVCYVSFFPQLVAGPIERARNLLPQLNARREFDWRGQGAGGLLIVQGFFKKLVVADNLGFLVDYVFAGGGAPSSPWLVVLGMWAFAFQIYGDFSGYSDIARGLSRCLGIDLVENFVAPYWAQNPRDFWLRWHVSLSSWLRDYLYVSIGGNRRGGPRTYANLIITMLLGGLWHGAAWTFVVWGAFHGGLLALHRPLRERQVSNGWLISLVRALLFFQVTCIGWLLFRAESLAQVVSMLASFGNSWSLDREAVLMFQNFLHFSWFVALLQGIRFYTQQTPAENRSPMISIVCMLYMLFHIYSEGVLERGTQFIYFQF